MTKSNEVDIIKGFAILAVVFLHVSTTFVFGVGRTALGGMWHVSVFFLVGGFFIKDKKDIVLRKFWRLYVPSAIIYLVMTLLHNVFVWLGWYPEGMPSPSDGVPLSMWGWSEYGVGLLKALVGYGEPVMGAMWFVYVLFLAHVGLWCVRKIVKNEKCLLVVLFAGQCVSWYATQRGYTIPRFNNTVTAMALMELGRLLWNGKIQLESMSIRGKWGLLLIAGCVFVGGLFVLGNVSLNKNWYVDPISLDVVAVATVVLLYGLARWMIRYTSYLSIVMAFVGRNSYAIMAGHILGFYITTSILKLFYTNVPIYRNTALVDPGHWYVGVMYLFVGVCVPLCIGWMMKGRNSSLRNGL